MGKAVTQFKETGTVYHRKYVIKTHAARYCTLSKALYYSKKGAIAIFFENNHLSRVLISIIME